MTDLTMDQENNAIAVGIDIGGTSTRIGIFPTLASPDFTQVARFPTQPNYLEQVQRIIEALHGNMPDNALGVGVSIGARIEKNGRRVVFGPNMPDYIGKFLADDLEQTLVAS